MRAISLMLLLLTLNLSSCYTTNIIPKNVAQVNTVHKFTAWSYLWGTIQDKRLENTDKVNCMGNGLSRVTVKNNFGFILLSIVTLGIVVPTHVEYECAKDAPPMN